MISDTPSLVFLSIAWLGMIPFMLGLWLVHRRYQNAVLADIGFCTGLGIVTVFFGVLTSGDLLRRIGLASMGVLYGFRLGGFLLVDRVLGKMEDDRYRKLREKWGKKAKTYFFLYFQMQALAIAVFSLPFLVLMENVQPFGNIWEILGVAIWGGAMVGEAMADSQLARFRRDSANKGKTCQKGLWRYSRHPNYFFEGLLWWAFPIMAVGVPYGWMTLAGPVFMIGALLKVSGIPFSEAQALASRGDSYREYQRTTSAFVPWFYKREPKNRFD